MKHFFAPFILSWGVLLMVTLCAHSEEAATSVEAVLKRALTESPLVQKINAQIASQRATGIQLATKENPVLESEIRFPTSYRDTRGSNEITVSLSQPLRLSDLSVRERVNSLMQAAASVNEKVEILSLAQQVKLAFVKVWALSERFSELKALTRQISKIEKAIAQPAEAGLVGIGESLLFKAEVSKTRHHQTAIEADLQRARAELTKVAGFPVEGKLKKPELSPLPPAETLLASGLLLPAQERAQLALSIARQQKQLSHLDSYPRFSPRIVYERTNDYADYVGVGISIDLPFFNRNQGDRTAKAAEYTAAETMSRYFSGEGYRQEVIALLASIESSTSLVNAYTSEIISILGKAVEEEIKIFSAGKGSAYRLWQMMRELSTAQAEGIERFVKLYSDRSELAILTGTDN